MKLDHARLMNDLRRLAEFGGLEQGVHRPFLSPQDIEAREWLRGRMEEAGLEARIDGIGNVYGRAPEASREVLVGSHTDTVPNGGWLDGSLGVIYGLSLVRVEPFYPLGAKNLGHAATRRRDQRGKTRRPCRQVFAVNDLTFVPLR